MSRKRSMAALDCDDEPIPALPAYDQMLFERRCAQIESETPDWVRQCRAKNHHVVLMTGPPQRCTFLCTRCGKDRK